MGCISIGCWLVSQAPVSDSMVASVVNWDSLSGTIASGYPNS